MVPAGGEVWTWKAWKPITGLKQGKDGCFGELQVRDLCPRPSQLPKLLSDVEKTQQILVLWDEWPGDTLEQCSSTVTSFRIARGSCSKADSDL